MSFHLYFPREKFGVRDRISRVCFLPNRAISMQHRIDMCLGRHPRTGSTAILCAGIHFFRYATLQAEAIVMHSFIGLKSTMSLN